MTTRRLFYSIEFKRSSIRLWRSLLSRRGDDFLKGLDNGRRFLGGDDDVEEEDGLLEDFGLRRGDDFLKGLGNELRFLGGDSAAEEEFLERLDLFFSS